MWHCEKCKKELNIKAKCSHIKSPTQVEIEKINRISNIFTDENLFICQSKF